MRQSRPTGVPTHTEKGAAPRQPGGDVMLPQVGDVLLSKRSATADYELSIVPNTPHKTCLNHADACARGHTVAEERKVDLWVTEDHTHFMLLGSFRAGSLGGTMRSRA